MQRMRRDRWSRPLHAAVACCLAGLALAPILHAEVDHCRKPRCVPPTPERWQAARYFRSTSPSESGGCFDAEELKCWLQDLSKVCPNIKKRCSLGDDILTAVFGIRRHELPDFIVFLRHEDKDKGRIVFSSDPPTLMWKKKNTPYVFGADHVWVLVFSDHPQYQPPLEVEIITLFEKSGNPFSGILGLLGVAPGSQEPKPAKSEKAPITWRPLWLTEDELKEGQSQLFLGTARLPVATDSVNFLSLMPVDPAAKERDSSVPKDTDRTLLLRRKDLTLLLRRDEPREEQEKQIVVDFHLVSGHFSNSRDGRLAFSVGFAATMNTQSTALGAGGTDTHFNGYVLAKFYALRPRVKAYLELKQRRLGRRSRPSVGLVLGTNIDDPFSEIVLGMSVGHIYGKTGIIVGLNRTPSSEDVDRKWRPFVGFEYTF